jgi:hypothetical protein
LGDTGKKNYKIVGKRSTRKEIERVGLTLEQENQVHKVENLLS